MASVRPNLAIAVAVVVVVLIAVGPSHAQTDCERVREDDQRTNSAVVHQCNEAGDFLPLQPTRDGNRHFCVTSGGQAVTSLSRHLKTCVCPLAAHAAKEEGKETVPQCDASGRFQRQQRDGNSRTCVDPNTGQVTKGPVPADQELDC